MQMGKTKWKKMYTVIAGERASTVNTSNLL